MATCVRWSRSSSGRSRSAEPPTVSLQDNETLVGRPPINRDARPVIGGRQGHRVEPYHSINVLHVSCPIASLLAAATCDAARGSSIGPSSRSPPPRLARCAALREV